jgi:hypothetical protein
MSRLVETGPATGRRMHTPMGAAAQRSMPRAARGWGRLAMLAVLAPIGALAGITGVAPPDPNRAPAGTYQIRCWQQGRLLFEENRVSLPADSAKYGIKMAGRDRNGKPIFVADTANATCLIRTVDEAKAWPR